MRRFVITVGISALLVVAVPPLAVGQPAAEADCVTVLPTTTTPVPTPAPTETTVPPVLCDNTTPPVVVATEPTLAAPPPPVTTTTVPSAVAVVAPETTTPTTTVPTTTVPTTTVPTAAVPTTVVPTTVLPTTTTAETTVPAVESAPSSAVPTVSIPAPAARAAAAPAAANLLNIEVPTAMTGPTTITPGTTWIGTMSMSVLGVGVEGWKSDVSLSNIRGSNTGRVITPTSATYSAPSSACTLGVTGSSPASTVTLSSVGTLAKRGGALCLTGWTATVSIGIPSTNVVADTYTATLTHSIY